MRQLKPQKVHFTIENIDPNQHSSFHPLGERPKYYIAQCFQGWEVDLNGSTDDFRFDGMKWRGKSFPLICEMQIRGKDKIDVKHFPYCAECRLGEICLLQVCACLWYNICDSLKKGVYDVFWARRYSRTTSLDCPPSRLHHWRLDGMKSWGTEHLTFDRTIH